MFGRYVSVKVEVCLSFLCIFFLNLELNYLFMSDTYIYGSFYQSGTRDLKSVFPFGFSWEK